MVEKFNYIVREKDCESLSDENTIVATKPLTKDAFIYLLKQTIYRDALISNTSDNIDWLVDLGDALKTLLAQYGISSQKFGKLMKKWRDEHGEYKAECYVSHTIN